MGGRARSDRPGDAEIVAGLRRRDPAAVEQLVGRYGRMIANWARTEGADADDVVQEVLLRAWRSGPDLAPDTFLPSWLKTVTTNTLRDRWRAAGRRPAVPAGLQIDGSTADPASRTTDRIAVEQLMSGLGSRERDVLRLLYISDLTMADAARSLGLSEEATKSLAARARRRLREKAQSLVAATPAGVLAVLVGRTAEAAGAFVRSAAALGAAAAAAGALAAGTVGYHRATHDEKPVRPPAVASSVADPGAPAVQGVAPATKGDAPGRLPVVAPVRIDRGAASVPDEPATEGGCPPVQAAPPSGRAPKPDTPRTEDGQPCPTETVEEAPGAERAPDGRGARGMPEQTHSTSPAPAGPPTDTPNRTPDEPGRVTESPGRSDGVRGGSADAPGRGVSSRPS
ncbi:MAG TPA: sigma-70 family RNA polymerase sigma factor [Actinomycetota bacterium]|nr:sigma-70 family RNA polymerase sigma factor [Actinomycetota bacterium]